MPHLSTAAMKSTPALPRPRTRGVPLVDPSPPNPSLVWLDIATGTEPRTPQFARKELEAKKVTECVLPAMTCAGPAATCLGHGINKRYRWATGVLAQSGFVILRTCESHEYLSCEFDRLSGWYST